MTWRPTAAMGAGDPRLVGASLDGVARRLGGPGTVELLAVFARWEDLVGPQVAAHTRPLSLRDGVLVIGADQPAWATQLRYLGADILTRLQARGAGGVQRVEVRVLGESPPAPRPPFKRHQTRR